MKKQLSLIFLAFSFFMNAQVGDYYIPTNKTDLVRNELKGNVKSTQTTTWKMVEKFGEPEKTSKVKVIEGLYLKNGYYEKLIFTGDEYDGKYTYTYLYNKKEQLEEIKAPPLKTFPTRYTFIYNDEGKLIEKNQYDKRNNLSYKDKYKYDKYGPISIAQYKGDGSLYRKKVYEWNSNSQKISEDEYGSKDEPLKMKTYAYNNNGDVSWFKELEHEEGKGITDYKYEYIYNSKNQKVKTISNYDGYITERAYYYDSEGSLIKKSKKSGKETSFTVEEEFTYTYDSNGNWTKELRQFLNDAKEKTFELREREIKYW